MGWLHSTPKIKQGKKTKTGKSRYETAGGNEAIICLPEADQLVVSAFHYLGLYDKSGMGISPLAWSDVQAFSVLSQYNLSAWEAENIVLMSRQYCVWRNKGEDQLCQSPWSNCDNVIEASAPAVCAGFKALAKKARNNKKKRP